MNVNVKKKLDAVLRTLKAFGKVVVAFSGGVDSTLLAKLAFVSLGKNSVAVTAVSPTYPSAELAEARKMARTIGIRHKIIRTNELRDKRFNSNPAERCYYCKSELFSALFAIAKMEGAIVVDASNMDDLSDYRPGAMAKKKFGVRSPLQEAGLTKLEIRAAAKRLELPNWNKPAQACLASRFPYGLRITEDALKMVEAAESAVSMYVPGQVRVRHHDGPVARIEVEKDRIFSLLRNAGAISKKLRKIGYHYVTVDLEGYRTGSMNETIMEEKYGQ